MRRSRENRRYKWLAKRAHAVGKKLQKLFVPDSPHAIEIVVVAILGHAEIIIIAGSIGVGLKTHRAIGRAMKKCGVITVRLQNIGNGRNSIGGIRRCDVWFDEHRDARQHRRHGVDRLATVGKTMFERAAHSQQRVQKRRVTTISATIQIAIEKTDILLAETFHDDNHHIQRTKIVVWLRSMNR